MEKFPFPLSSVIVKMLRLSLSYSLKLHVFYGDMSFMLTEFSHKSDMKRKCYNVLLVSTITKHFVIIMGYDSFDIEKLLC